MGSTLALRRISAASWNSSLRTILGQLGRVREDILGAIRKLVAFPHQGHQRTDLTSRPLRFQTVRSYLIAYAPDEKPLLVIAVLHGRRNPRVIAAVLRARR
ncbi:MAG: type II toxin-antitoxin system RelE/ParE family toxin [Terriglobales bacterium]